MNSVSSANITKNARTILDTTQELWSCSATSTRTEADEESALASTTVIAGHAGQTVLCLKPNDPYPTWPFTMVEPKSLARWCRKNLSNPGNYEEAPF